MKKILSISLAVLFFFFSCQNKNTSTVDKQQSVNNEKSKSVNNRSEMKIISSSFNEGDLIPSQYTCTGENISPPVSWTGIPANAKSLALVVDDPDAPAGDWVHWVIYNIPFSMTGLQEKFPKSKTMDNGIIQGVNDFKNNGYNGPCPPSGTHRYYFRLYALDINVNDADLSKDELNKAMDGHILAKSELMGKYKK